MRGARASRTLGAMAGDYDAIVMGARCAGSPTAMLLARSGHRVLLVDKATFPSDTMSTHLVHPPGVAALERWGLLERLEATGCPPVETYSFDFGPLTISGSPQPIDGIAHGYCAAAHGARQAAGRRRGRGRRRAARGLHRREILADDGAVTGIRGHAKGGARSPSAPGRDRRRRQALAGRQDGSARAVQRAAARSWRCTTPTGATCRSKVSRPRSAPSTAAAGRRSPPTTISPCSPSAGRSRSSKRTAATSRATSSPPWISLPSSPSACAAAKRESKFIGSAELPGYFRKPFGPGWALLGDAGYHKNPITAMGINDAFRDAELVAAALDDAFSGRRSYEEGMSDYQRSATARRCRSTSSPTSSRSYSRHRPRCSSCSAAMHGNQEAMDGFVSVQAATLPAPEFFAPENIGRIMA